jgi:hypothetical protein
LEALLGRTILPEEYEGRGSTRKMFYYQFIFPHEIRKQGREMTEAEIEEQEEALRECKRAFFHETPLELEIKEALRRQKEAQERQNQKSTSDRIWEWRFQRRDEQEQRQKTSAERRRKELEDMLDRYVCPLEFDHNDDSRTTFTHRTREPAPNFAYEQGQTWRARDDTNY